ncbi:MAG: hypothetical protein BroJett026_08290 [Betaproteobacteria bacterium]|nr:MAG: hypothetical protein BroJett026_08290 [Betaproteobacteria bacterium]
MTPPHSTTPVDVVLPAYNGAAMIRAAIESALRQDVPLRIIVVDDGSRDDSAAIARSCGERVEVIVQENRGVSGARNTALRAARAPYVAFLDQDDVWKPGKIRRQLDLIEHRPDVGMVFTDMTILDPDGAVHEDGFLAATSQYAALEREALGDHAFLLPPELAEAVVRFNFVSPSTTLVRREALEQVGAFDEQFRLCDDAECWMRLLSRWRGIAIEECLVLSYRWGGNASLVRARALMEERIRIGDKVRASPASYPPGSVDYFRRARPVALYRMGMAALRGGDATGARAHFAESLRERFAPATLAALAFTMLPAALRRPLLRAKRAAGLRWSLRIE